MGRAFCSILNRMDSINYLAILAAAFASMLVGFLWYGPLFGKYWMKLKGYTPEAMKAMKITPLTAMSLAGVCALVTAFVLATFVQFLNPQGVGGAVMLAVLVWIGFVAATHANYVLFEERPLKLFLFDIAHLLCAILTATLVITLWP